MLAFCVQFRNDDRPKVVEFLRKAQKQHPADAWINHELANNLMNVSPFDAWECVAFRRAALAARPENPVLRVALDHALFHLHVTRGHYHSNTRQWDRVVIEYSKAIEMEPKYTEILLGRGHAYEKLGLWDKAVADCEKAVEIAPDNAAYQRYLARILATCPEAKLRDPSRAIELATKVVQRMPKDNFNRYTLGVAHYRAGDWKAAIAAFEKYREIYKGTGDVRDWLFLAMAHRKLGHAVESQKAYEGYMRWWEVVSKQVSSNWEEYEGLRRIRSEAEEVLELKKR
jgi:tetratricopeptide (TPR) repeat protein